jgi:hypothetical protein
VAYIYDLASATPTTPIALVKHPAPSANDVFGRSVAIDGATVVVGASGTDEIDAPNRGAAYIFSPKPALSIVSTTPGLLTLSWMPATSSGFVLQYADSLASTNWLNAPSGAANPATTPLTNVARFYRLFQP